MKTYTEKTFPFPEMRGFSQKLLNEHLKLYSGYVKNVNILSDKLHQLEQNTEENKISISELKRRYSFEWNGMRLHENYFETLGGNGKSDGSIVDEIKKQFSSYERWLVEFKNIGSMRGIGWTILCHDKEGGVLSNIWVSNHEIGHLAGTKILIAMDVWEHAYLIDYLPSQRGEYIESFFNNLKWSEIEKRFSS